MGECVIAVVRIISAKRFTVNRSYASNVGESLTKYYMGLRRAGTKTTYISLNPQGCGVLVFVPTGGKCRGKIPRPKRQDQPARDQDNARQPETVGRAFLRKVHSLGLLETIGRNQWSESLR